MTMEFLRPIPFVHHVGMRLESFGDGHARIDLPTEAHHANSLGMVHGGVLTSLMDVAMAHAARSHTPQAMVVTIELKTTFLQGAHVREGEVLQAHGQILHRTRSMVFTEGRILNGQGELCAHATGTFRFVQHSTPQHGDTPS